MNKDFNNIPINSNASGGAKVDGDFFFPPLKNPIENRITVYRAVRYLGLSFTEDQYNTLSFIVFSKYTGELKHVKQKRVFGKCKIKKYVLVFPESFLNELLDIIKDFNKAINAKPKRRRIKRII